MVFGTFWSENGSIYLACFGLVLGMVFEETTGAYGGE